MIKIVRVTGESLSPAILPGDYLVVVEIPFFLRRLKAGDFIVFRHPSYGRMVKCIESLSEDEVEIRVLGMNPESIDSRQFGPIQRGWVTGKSILHIRQPARKPGASQG